jgi:hypothetical protein
MSCGLATWLGASHLAIHWFSTGLKRNFRCRVTCSVRTAVALLALTMALVACEQSMASRLPANPTPQVASPNPSTPTPVASSNPSPTMAPNTALGVFTGSAQDTPGHYSIRIVDIEGQVRASYLAALGGDEIPSPLAISRVAVFLPTISLSDTRAYFPDGDGYLRVLAADGSTSIVHTLPNVRGKTRAVFAVSPDDKRIAVSRFDWSVAPMSVHIYVEDVAGGGNHVDIFDSTSAYEWPVAWHAGNIVLAVNPVHNASNPYGAGAYHVVKASDGTRIATMGGTDCLVVGPLSVSGTACASDCASTATCVEAVDWSGARSIVYRRPNDQGSGASWSALSPDGRAVTTGTQGPGDGVATSSGIVRFTGTVVDLRNWWIDNHYVLTWLCVGENLSGCSDVIGAIDVATGSALPGSIQGIDATPIGWFPVSPNH